jgi:hypothetical protein
MSMSFWLSSIAFTDRTQASKEAYFVALRRKEAPTREEVFRE